MSSKDTQVILSAEKQFMFQDAFNRGYIQMPRMIVACIGLSIQAKGVYGFISNYVYEHGKSAFPSIHRIAIACELTAKSVVKHIGELVEKGLIKKSRRGRGRTNDYYIKDVHEVYVLHVSEMLWTAMDGAMRSTKGNSWESIYEALTVISSGLKAKGYSLTRLACTEENKNLLESDFISILEGGKPELNYIIPKVNKPNTADRQPKASTGGTYRDRHESEWKADNFRFYFYERYKEVTGLDHPQSDSLHRTVLSRITKKLDGDKTALKKHIDAFFEMGYSNMSLEQFGANARFTEIYLYITEGKKPFYIEKQGKAQEKKQELANAEQQYHGVTDDEFTKILRGEK